MIILLLASLFLSEILANEPGSAVSLEWIELAANTSTTTDGATLLVNADTMNLSTLALDSGAFLVICRDSIRFEQHYGDSSGIWGDAANENYALTEGAFELTNASGHVELRSASSTDTFTYTVGTPDGVSFERIGDMMWQATDIAVGSTPGSRNHGLPWPHDWAIIGVSCEPSRPTAGDLVRVQVIARNVGIMESTSLLRLFGGDSVEISSSEVAGDPGEADTLWFDLVAEVGYNALWVILADDDRMANNSMRFGFYASEPFLLITEVYAVPEAGEPEWLELYVAADTAIEPDELFLADLSDTVPLSDLILAWPAGSYTVVTSGASAFVTRYPDFAGAVVELPNWPTLNNDGDTLSVLYYGSIVERVGYPSFATRRGVSYERVATSDVWSFSVASAGATPGVRNSIDVPYSQDVSIAVAPNPFAPGQGEEAQISYVTPFEASGELRIYSGDGRYLRTLLPQGPMVSGDITWDGRDGQGRLLPIGVYLLQLRVTEPSEQSRLDVVVIAR